MIVLALPALIPLMLIIAVAVRIGSTGPVLFKQGRIGHRGRRFVCLKFRTMRAGADTTVHQRHWNQLVDSNLPMIKIDSHGDSLLVPGGWWLRASGLDELPQVINVLRGEMSLVGPRPCLPYEYDRYLPWQKERFNALPGLTGLWQVSGKNKTTLNGMVHLDIRYTRNMALWMDLGIIFRTVPALIMHIRDTHTGRKSFTRPHKPNVVSPPSTTSQLPLKQALSATVLCSEGDS